MFFARGRNGSLPPEYIDFLLISELYHCTPEELDRQDAAKVQMHLEFMRIREQERLKEHKRSEQRARITHK